MGDTTTNKEHYTCTMCDMMSCKTLHCRLCTLSYDNRTRTTLINILIGTYIQTMEEMKENKQTVNCAENCIAHFFRYFDFFDYYYLLCIHSYLVASSGLLKAKPYPFIYYESHTNIFAQRREST